ncbi:BrnT family toxin [Methylobacterium indicum]|uniref:BrnT family toxin n=1 Tax=Methylobacterium indicum TaxID=1775910 RepID=UPI0024347D08|nr:BrnT family toxin [Methylobacterium indicum]
MRIVWDEPKREMNLSKHGLDFADARDRFVFEDATILPSYPAPDGRPRFVALNDLDGRLVAVVFSPLGTQALTLISLRPANRKERRIFENA